MIPEMPPQRHAKPGFAPSSIIERAAQHLDNALERQFAGLFMERRALATVIIAVMAAGA
jgi:hypothetical protein